MQKLRNPGLGREKRRQANSLVPKNALQETAGESFLGLKMKQGT